MDKYINPFTDFGFKRLFGTEPNKDLLIDFLNSVVLPKGKAIADLTYAQAEHQGAHPNDRKVVFDLHCIGSAGERFIVEMQKGKQSYFKDRSVYYSTFPIREQAPVGIWDFKLNEVYTVAVLDFVLDKSERRQEVRHEVWLKDQHGEVFYNKLCFVFLEMPNFELEESQLQTNAEKWLWVLKQLPKLEKRPMTLQGKVFEKLFSAAEIARLSPKERAEYEANMKIYRDYKNTIDTSFGEGFGKGFDEGFGEGQTAGKIDAMLAFHSAGVDTATIAKALHMMQAEVQALIEKHKPK